MVSATTDVALRGNEEGLGWIVQKFGGTSVGKFPDKIARDIVKASLAGNRVVVVCSARSTGKKAEGTTSRLLGVYEKLRAVNTAGASNEDQQLLIDEANLLIVNVCNDHIFAAESFVPETSNLRSNLIECIKAECQELSEYIVAAKRFNLEINARSKDRVVSFGEKLSCLFMTALLKGTGVDAEYVDLSDIFHNDTASALGQQFYSMAAAAFAYRVARCGTRIPVVTGFFGNVPGSLMEGDIGRGYTDLCAALFAVGLEAQELQIWKEVDGIFTADPTKVPTASLLTSITPSEAAELTFYGSEVIHHLTMDQVIHAEPPIPIRIKNVNNPRGNGTLVVPRPQQARKQHTREPSLLTPGSPPRPPKRPTAVTIKDNISIINIHSNKRSISHGFFARVFKILDQHSVSVDLISTSEVHVSLAIHSGSLQLEHISAAQRELEECGEVTIHTNMSILSLVGADMRQMVGIAGRMFSVLGEHQINLEMISQGASEINISCVIDAMDATRAMNVLHTHLFTFLDD
ncbi:aspartokinase-like protein [Emericellopsis cladophorae]|uniref:Aspartokinase n=1 Tax=Emericellopsis cladophorae TaxID=2686198 RepID=A0A9Q0BFG0_9HYPO|nr:aspartokinase-like protein [Emericellopsis cladophorae]KAI6782856.1 aspartokinase-like protein [Emericellopsis cladophorae]